MSPSSRSARWISRAAGITLLIPPAGSLWLLLKFFVPVVTQDRLDAIAASGITAGGLSPFERLAFVVNEHHIVFPHAFLLPLRLMLFPGEVVPLSQAHLWAQALLTWGWQMGAAGLLCALVWRTGGTLSPVIRWILIFLAVLAGCSPVFHFPPSGFPFQLIVFLAALLVTDHARLGRKRLLAAMALAFVATFSNGNGILAWAALLPLLWHRSPPETRRTRVALWCAAAVCTAAFYVWGFPGAQPQALHPPSGMGEMFRFALTLAGMPIASRNMGIAPILGIALAALLGYCGVRAPEGERSRVLPWLCLGAYALLTVLLTAYARTGLGMEAAQWHRYAYLSFPLALSALAAACLTHSRFPLLQGLLCIGMLAAQALETQAMRGVYAFERASNRDALACVQTFRLASDACLRAVHDAPARIRPVLARLEHDRILQPFVLPPDARWRRSAARAGEFQALASSGSGALIARGIAVLPGCRRAEHVVLTLPGSRAMAAHGAAAWPLPRSTRGPCSANAEWRIDVSSIVANAPGVRLEAWIYDPTDHALLPLGERSAPL